MSDIIFLHGASSSGKSTLAKALQAQVTVPFWHISIDHLRDSGVLPLQRYQSGEFDWAANRTQFFEGFHHSLGAFADAGNNLILEHILDTGGWLESLVKILRPHPVFFVGIHCPLPLLQTREKQRADRPSGSAEKDFYSIHQGLTYDLEIDGSSPVPANVQLILESWKSGKRVSDFS